MQTMAPFQEESDFPQISLDSMGRLSSFWVPLKMYNFESFLISDFTLKFKTLELINGPYKEIGPTCTFSGCFKFLLPSSGF